MLLQRTAQSLYLNRSTIPRTLVQIPPMLLPHPHTLEGGWTSTDTKPGVQDRNLTGSKLAATPRNGNHYLLPARRTLTNSTSTSSFYSFNVLSFSRCKSTTIYLSLPISARLSIQEHIYLRFITKAEMLNEIRRALRVMRVAATKIDVLSICKSTTIYLCLPISARLAFFFVSLHFHIYTYHHKTNNNGPI